MNESPQLYHPKLQAFNICYQLGETSLQNIVLYITYFSLSFNLLDWSSMGFAFFRYQENFHAPQNSLGEGAGSDSPDAIV